MTLRYIQGLNLASSMVSVRTIEGVGSFWPHLQTTREQHYTTKVLDPKQELAKNHTREKALTSRKWLSKLEAKCQDVRVHVRDWSELSPPWPSIASSNKAECTSRCLNAKSVHVSDQSKSSCISRKLTTFISVNAIPSLLILFTFQLPSCSFWSSIIFSGLVRGI